LRRTLAQLAQLRPGEQARVVAIAPLDANRITAHHLQLIRLHLRINVGEVDEPLAGDFIDAPRAAASDAHNRIRNSGLKAVMPGNVQDARGMVAADAQRGIDSGFRGHGEYLGAMATAQSGEYYSESFRPESSVLGSVPMWRTIAVSFVALFLVVSSLALKAADPLPVVYTDDFEKGADNWQPLDADQWKVKKTDDGQVYSQHVKKSNYKPPHRSPTNIALLKDVTVGDFELKVKVRSTHEDYGHRDACLVFGYQDPSHFYYVHLGKQADDHANQIFIVNNAARLKISVTSTAGTNWQERWHDVKIVRDAKDGKIEVYFDDMKKPVMTANDKTFTWGRIGVGTFDDTADFDNLELRGEKVVKATSAESAK
jgi:hypothetical protein